LREDKRENVHRMTAYSAMTTHDRIRLTLLAKNMMALVPHPPFSLLAPSDFFLFPRMRMKLKGRRSDTVE
jgi:hypothetical protein